MRRTSAAVAAESSKRRFGKAGRSILEGVVYHSLGARSAKVVRGPGRGLDNAFMALENRQVMIVTSDPVSAIPEIGMRLSAWLSVHLIASDYTTSGLKPGFATFVYNMPREMATVDVESYLTSMGEECRNLGVAIVAGHTGSYPGGGLTVVGGGTMFGFCGPGEYVDTTMARPGDAILMTKGAAMEAAAMLAHSFPRYVERKAGRGACRRAKQMLRNCSTVKDALTASSLGLGTEGVTSMHDATEGGILGGLAEMADASGKAFSFERQKIHVPPESTAVCSAFGIDPLATVSEGSLILTCNPKLADELRGKLRRNGIPAFEIGRVRSGSGLWVSTEGSVDKRVAPKADMYWSVYEQAVRSHLR